MNSNRQMEAHYINTGFPYSVTESFMDLFEGLTYAQADATFAEALQAQGNTYWSMYTSPYKYEFSGSYTDSYYDFGHTFEISDYTQRLEESRRAWENPVISNNLDVPQQTRNDNGGGTHASRNPRAEECIQVQRHGNGSQVVWQDNIDPDQMTYEELLELGEAVGTQSRGLTQERIASLPVTKYKCSFFCRKKTQRERCVICQMEYKRGDRQMILPCKHPYHPACVTRWLSINKACPICFAEVPGEEPKNH